MADKETLDKILEIINEISSDDFEVSEHYPLSSLRSRLNVIESELFDDDCHKNEQIFVAKRMISAFSLMLLQADIKLSAVKFD